MNVVNSYANPDLDDAGSAFGYARIRAPSTLGSFLRSFTWGNDLQLGKVHRQVLAELARRTPLLPGKGRAGLHRHRRAAEAVHGHAKQDAAFRHTKIGGKGLLVRGLNVLAASVCTPLAAPVIAATRRRGGNAHSARGAAYMITEAACTARPDAPARWWCDGLSVLRLSGRLGGPLGWSALFGHRAHRPEYPRRDRRHPRGRLDPDPYPGHLG